jgi:putative heme-binding domain-containing protein
MTRTSYRTIGLTFSRWRLICVAVLAIATRVEVGQVVAAPPAKPTASAAAVVPLTADGALDYASADPELRVERLASSKTESFLAVRVDTLGRVFVGGREALFVYEPDDRGGYSRAKLLYRFPAHSWVYDIEFRGNDLYVLTLSALYVIPGGVNQRTDLKPRRLVWGVPRGHVHQCFHALAWGPEGDLYLTMGDPLWYYGDFNRADHWGFWNFHVQPEGTLVPYNGVGGVFRCRPDGSRFEAVAGGLRNPCGLAFDHHWNLFSNDNDHESLPARYVPGRLVHVTPQAYFSWPRGWMPFKTPDRLDLLDTMTDSLGRCVPVGQSYYDEEFLPQKYRHNLLLARWESRAVSRFPLQERGASFKASERPLLVGRNDARPVGVCVGRGGRVFVTIAYMDHNDESPIYRSDLAMITRADDPASHPFLAFDITTAPAAKLWSELSEPTWGRRLRAHLELLRRGGASLREANSRLKASSRRDPARPHAIWLAAAAGDFQTMTTLLRDTEAAVRAQAIRALAEFNGFHGDSAPLIAALNDPDLHVQQAALSACFRASAPWGEPLWRAVATGPAVKRDTYLRQPAARLLAQWSEPDQLQMLLGSGDEATRLAGILAVGFRLTMPPVDQPPRGDLPLARWANREQAYKLTLADGKFDLRSAGRIGTYTVAEHWRVGGHTGEQERLFALLLGALNDASDANRLQAAFFLRLLNDPRSELRIAEVQANVASHRLAAAPLRPIEAVWCLGPFPEGKGASAAAIDPERGPVDLNQKYRAGTATLEWTGLAAHGEDLDLSKQMPRMGAASFYIYTRLDAQARQLGELQISGAVETAVWLNGKRVAGKKGDSPPKSRGLSPFFPDALSKGPRSTPQATVKVPFTLQAGGNELVCRFQCASGGSVLRLGMRSDGPCVAHLPEKPLADLLANRLPGPRQDGVEIPKEFLAVDWPAAVARGDAKRGRKLFVSLSCVKCHAITNDSPVVGGPSLADAKRRFTVAYIVESVLLPSKQISPLYRASLIMLDTGQSYTGLIVQETSDHLELVLPDATRKAIPVPHIESRQTLNVSPMPVGLVHTPEELRDLVAYVLSDKPRAP